MLMVSCLLPVCDHRHCISCAFPLPYTAAHCFQYILQTVSLLHPVLSTHILRPRVNIFYCCYSFLYIAPYLLHDASPSEISKASQRKEHLITQTRGGTA